MTNITKAAQDALEALDEVTSSLQQFESAHIPVKVGLAERVTARANTLRAALQDKAGEVREPVAFSGAEEAPPVFGRRWRLADDGFGLQRDDADGNYVQIDDAISVLHQSLAAQPAPVTDGFALVPVEPTDAMVQAAFRLDLSYIPDRAAVYRAMIAASQ